MLRNFKQKFNVYKILLVTADLRDRVEVPETWFSSVSPDKCHIAVP